jgi:hypothetical protein
MLRMRYTDLYCIEEGQQQFVALSPTAVAKFLVPNRGIVDPGLGLLYRLARLHIGWRAASQGLRILLLSSRYVL